jgi:hypothetical protein
VDVQDAVLSLQSAVDLLTPTEKQRSAGDVNADGLLDVEDSMRILQSIVFETTLEEPE